MKNKGSQWALAVVAMIAVIPISQYLGRTIGEATAKQEPTRLPPQPDFSDIEVLVSRQDSEGVTEADFDQQFLANLEAWTLERTAANAAKYWDAAAVPQADRALVGESVLLERYGHRLAIVRVKIGDESPTATIVGVKGTELIRIACVARTAGSVPVAAGPCDAKIREIFGDPLENDIG
ncbi:MAG: hypothetical protein K2Y17_00020 [Qipengyuania sp.]|nr:hypothetical protein [Qipengyuania sp.]